MAITLPTNATTQSAVNLRQGPGTQFKALSLLPNRSSLQVLGESGEWLRVSINGQSGYVHRSYIVLPSQKIPSGFLISNPAIAGWALAPQHLLSSPSDADSRTLQLIKIWNKYGGILQKLSDKLRIDVAVATSVIAAESSGSGFVNGRLIIRFENHYFWRLWGKDNADKYSSYFSFDQAQTWTKHRFRNDPKQPWIDSHGTQDGEWNALNKAKSLNDEMAKRSISMGLPQIMGANYNLIGYESAAQMVDSFSRDERNQVVGLFDFIQGPGTISSKIIALQNQDFVGFAEQYNGPGQAAQYGGMLRFYFELFKLMHV